MKRLLMKLLIVCGLALAFYSGRNCFAPHRYLRHDMLLLTVIEERVKQKTEAGYGFVAGVGVFTIGLVGLICQKPREA